MFNYSRPYSSGEFSIYKEPKQFIRTLAGYAIISNKELGLDIFVESDGNNRFITVTEDVTRNDRRL